MKTLLIRESTKIKFNSRAYISRCDVCKYRFVNIDINKYNVKPSHDHIFRQLLSEANERIEGRERLK